MSYNKYSLLSPRDDELLLIPVHTRRHQKLTQNTTNKLRKTLFTRVQTFIKNCYKHLLNFLLNHTICACQWKLVSKYQT